MAATKIKTAELTGTALDWAVAHAEGNVRLQYDSREGLVINNILGWIAYRPSVAWIQGGPIIERDDINVIRFTHSEISESGAEIYRKDGWMAHTTATAYWITPKRAYGPTPLIAAMRCYVARKLGDEVEIPEELL